MSGIKSEKIVSAKIESVPNLCVPGDPTRKDGRAYRGDITSHEAHEQQEKRGKGKSGASHGRG